MPTSTPVHLPAAPRQLHLRRLALLLAAIVLPCIGCSSTVSDETVQRITVQDAAQRLASDPQTNLFIDTRSQVEYDTAHIPGARRMQLPDIDPKDPDPALAKYKNLIVYGANPGSAAPMAIAKRLLIAEYGDVFLMEDGFERWLAAGFKTAKSP